MLRVAGEHARSVKGVHRRAVALGALHVGDEAVGDAVFHAQGVGIHGLVKQHGQVGAGDGGGIFCGFRGCYPVFHGIVGVYLIPGGTLGKGLAVPGVDAVDAGGQRQRLGPGDGAQRGKPVRALALHQAQIDGGFHVFGVPRAGGDVGEHAVLVGVGVFEVVKARGQGAGAHNGQCQHGRHQGGYEFFHICTFFRETKCFLLPSYYCNMNALRNKAQKTKSPCLNKN